MIVGTVIRRALLPAAAVVVETNLIHQNESQAQDSSYTCRPSELPIYTPDPPMRAAEEIKQFDQTPNFIENSVKVIRENLANYYEEFYAYKTVAKQSLTESKQNVEWLIDYLRQEDNTLPKAGAIGIGALTGFIFGLRGGLFKRTIYATTGALGMAAVCYPKEASEYAQVGAVEGKKYLTIAYNFAYGVKKDDPPLELPSLPTVPKNFSEVWDSIKSTASSFISDESSQKVEEVKNATNVSNNHSPFLTETPHNVAAEGQAAVYPGSLEYSNQVSGEPESFFPGPALCNLYMKRKGNQDGGKNYAYKILNDFVRNSLQ